MSKVLLTYKDNYADEFDISAWQIIDSQKWETLKEEFLKKVGDHSFVFCFGTNEEMEYDDSETFLDHVDERKLTDEEYQTIKRVFNCTEMGEVDIMHTMNYAIENIEDEEDEGDDND